jgi:hypothetical protein
MQNRDIPTNQWKPFFDDFSRLHRGERVDVETLDPAVGPRSKICDCPLLGVVAMPDCGQGLCLEVVTGAEPDTRTYTVRQPSKISVCERDGGQVVAVQIGTSEGAVVMLRFEPDLADRPRKPPGNYLG